MRLSIILLSFNQRQFLETAICSIISQDFENLELIVVDGGSTDGSDEIIRAYAHRCSKVIVGPDSGPADGLNKGLDVAGGDIVGWLNSDDVFLPGTFKSVVEAFELLPADVISGNGYFFDIARMTLSPARSTGWHTAGASYGAVALLQPSTFIRRAAVGSVRFNVRNRTCWDGEFYVDLALTGASFERIRRDWALFTLHAGSITQSGRLQARYLLDSRAIFHKIRGRQWRWYDTLLLYPIRLYFKLRDWVRAGSVT